MNKWYLSHCWLFLQYRSYDILWTYTYISGIEGNDAIRTFSVFVKNNVINVVHIIVFVTQ